jgi:hypothetical protein
MSSVKSKICSAANSKNKIMVLVKYQKYQKIQKIPKNQKNTKTVNLKTDNDYAGK